MKTAKRFLSSVRLSKWLILTRSSPVGFVRIQVTHFSHNICPLFSATHNNYGLVNSHRQMFNFSSTSKPDYIEIVELINTKNWCKELENELEEFHPTLTYETVTYVLKSLQRNPNKALFFFNWFYGKHGVKPNPVVYGVMLNILGNKQLLDAFSAFTKRLGEDSCCVDHTMHLPVMRKILGVGADWIEVCGKISKEGAIDMDDTLKNIIDVIQGSDSVDAIKNKLGELEVDSLSETSILRVYMALHDFPLKALCFYHWLKEGLGYTHNAVTYNAILRVLGKKETIEEFWGMVEELKSEGYDIDIDTYEKVANKLRRMRMIKDAVKLYELMMDGPYKPLVRDYIPFLRDTSLTLKNYEETGNAPSKKAYDQIYKSLIIVHRFDEAEKVLKMMSDAGYEPDAITYSVGVLELGKAGRLEDSVKLLNEANSKGYALYTKTWNNKIRAHCKAGESDQALECFTSVLEMNSKVENLPLEDLVDCLCNNGRVDDAYNMITEVVDKHNARPLLSIFRKLVQELLREKKLEEAMSLLCLMKKCKYTTPQDPYVYYISKFGTVDDAVEFLKEYSQIGNRSHVSYGRVLESFLKEGRESEARELLDKSPEHIHKCKSIMVQFSSKKEEKPQQLLKEGRESEARELLDKSPEHIHKCKSIMVQFSSKKEEKPQQHTGKLTSLVDLFSSKKRKDIQRVDLF